MKRSLRVLPLLLFLPLVPVAAAAPDTPPALTWETTLSGDGFACTQAGSSGLLGQRVVSDVFSNVYVMSRCDTPSGAGDDRIVIQKVSSSGSIVWSRTFDCEATISDFCTPGGIAVEPGANGNIVFCYDDSGSLSVNQVVVQWINKGTGADLDTLTGLDTALLGGSTSPCENDSDIPFGVTVKIHNATALNYTFTDGNSMVQLQCTGYDETLCVRIFERSGNPNGDYVKTEYAMGAGGTYPLFQCDNAPDQVIRYVDEDDGATVASTMYTPQPELRWCGRQSGVDTDKWWSVLFHVSSEEVRYQPITISTWSPGAIVAPTEPTVGGHTGLSFKSHDIDAQDNIFYCGRVQAGSNSKGMIMKVSTDSASQRWNITIDKTATTTTGEDVRDCIISPDGSLYALLTNTHSGGVRQTFLRKYGEAAVGRDVPTDFTGFPSAVTTTTTQFQSGGALGFKDFCLAVGFEDAAGRFLCGLIIVITGAVLVAFVLADRNEKGAAKFGNASVFGGGGTFFGLGIFVTVIELWPTYTTIIMIVLTAAVILFVVKRQFLSGGDD